MKINEKKSTSLVRFPVEQKNLFWLHAFSILFETEFSVWWSHPWHLVQWHWLMPQRPDAQPFQLLVYDRGTMGRDGDKIWRPKAGLGNNADMSLGHVRGWEDAMQREKNAKFHLLGEKQKNQFVAKGRGMAVWSLLFCQLDFRADMSKKHQPSALSPSMKKMIFKDSDTIFMILRVTVNQWNRKQCLP